MQHHLYKEPQDGNECTPDDWKQTDIIRANLEAEYAKRFNAIDKYKLKESRRELKVTVIFALGFTAGFVWAILSGIFARMV